MRKWFIGSLIFVAAVLAGCAQEADIASHNVSRAADNFEVQRRIVFINGITGDYLLVVEGLCSIGNNDTAGRLSVTCKTGPSDYKKHFLGLSDNVTFVAEQLQSKAVNAFHYKVVFKPQSILPDIDLSTSGDALRKLP